MGHSESKPGATVLANVILDVFDEVMFVCLLACFCLFLCVCLFVCLSVCLFVCLFALFCSKLNWKKPLVSRVQTHVGVDGYREVTQFPEGPRSEL